MFSVFGRWYKRKFSDPDAAMLLILILISSALLLDLNSPIRNHEIHHGICIVLIKSKEVTTKIKLLILFTIAC